MIEFKDKYNSAKVFTDFVEESAQSQIMEILNHPAFEKSKIRFMPDIHAGAGCCIGFTAKMNDDKIVPNLIGVDINCGMLAVNIGKITNIDSKFKSFDEFIRNNIPSGFSINSTHNIKKDEYLGREMKRISDKIESLEYDTALKAIGTLGGGNHFAELNIDSKDNIWIVVHTGSRNPGLQIANYHQKKAVEYCEDQCISIPKSLAYLEGELAKNYIDDMKVMEYFASINRFSIVHKLLSYFGLEDLLHETIESVHNYIDINNMIIRKGAISAQKNEKLIIPLNMKDGSIIGIGKGNIDWNYSGPHGAGRIYSRSKAKEHFTVEEFELQMDGIWSSCIGSNTLDESPMAYKGKDEIINAIGDSVEIIEVIRPLYNYKSTESKSRKHKKEKGNEL